MKSSKVVLPSPPGAESITEAALILESLSTKPDPGVTPRVVCLCLLLAVGLSWAISIIDYRFSNTFLGATHLPPGAIGALLLLLVVVNPLLWVLRQRRFSRNELLTTYLCCLFATTVAGIGGNNYWVSFILGPFYFGTPANGWIEKFQNMPWWMTPALNRDGTVNKAVVDDWFNGLPAGAAIPWSAWVVPLAAWSALLLALYVMMSCVAVMVRAQWGAREHLTFPLLRLPLELTEGEDENGSTGFGAVRSRFFRNPLMWMGFSIAAFIQIMNGLHLYFPDVPAVPLEIDSGPLFSEAPWNQMGSVPMRVFPIAVGVCYLLTREVSFSLWFFFWAAKFQLVTAYYLGYPPSTLPRGIGAWGGQQIFLVFQEIGAYLGIIALILWRGREHFRLILRRAFARERASIEESHEALSYPCAFWGLLFSFAFVVGWATLAGIDFRLTLVLWLAYLMVATVLSRIIAETGLLFVHSSWLPLGTLANLFGAGPGTTLSLERGLAPATLLESSLVEDFRGSLMPSFVQSFKLAADRGINARALYALIFAVIILGLGVAEQMNVRLGYENGGLALQSWIGKDGPRVAPNSITSIASGVRDVSAGFAAWIGVGVAMMLALTWLHSYFSWFPFHPLGYAVAVSAPMFVFWPSVFIAWTCKTLIVRFAGADTARRLNAFFLGLVAGDVALMLFWIVIDCWQGRMGHNLMP
ncbi:hypothetical protein B1R32_12720 [Abditibacterium utsteinense]|uniref:Uncharacterized protein n=1 Tax=Abditibacterium utsteinense TaxID=1960156 RepID=A0A2S8SP91_9BACT|nr:DUF6785 family protein [Abditibacterium utsteinense]PQV62608.1 hypothetical protein B1R32_12720 [Abditibacterium utsteinense]